MKMKIVTTLESLQKNTIVQCNLIQNKAKSKEDKQCNMV